MDPEYSPLLPGCVHGLRVVEAPEADIEGLVGKADGAEFRFFVPVPTKTCVEFEITPPGKTQTFRARGVVTWLSDGSSGRPPGLGIDVVEILSSRNGSPDQPDAESQAENAVDDASPDQATEAAQTPPPAEAEPQASAEGKPDREPSRPIPAGTAFAKNFSDLIGSEVTLKKGAPLEIKDDTSLAVAVFADDEGKTSALVVCDVEMVCWSGGALSMLPVGDAQTMINSGKPEGEILDNYREILNVGANLFNVGDTDHVKLTDVHLLPGDAPDEVSALMADPAARSDFDVQIPGYGDGRMAVMVG